MHLKNEVSGAAVVLACAFLLGPACTATAQAPMPGGGVTISAKFPSDVSFHQGPSAEIPQRVNETILLTLTNSSNAPITLQRPNACESHTWTVTDSSGQTIDDMAICPMIFMPVTQTIAAHGVFTASQTVAMDGSKYQDGGHYSLHYTFWGVAAQNAFTAHVTR